MDKVFFIFGSSSFIAKKLFQEIKKDFEVYGFSRKKLSIKNNFKINYNDDKYLEIISNKLKNKKPVFIFSNAISDKKILINSKKNDIEKIIKINLLTPINITRKILKKYIYKKPSFLYFSSSRGFNGDKGISIYSASKNGLEGFVRSSATEYGSLEIIFRTIHLGLFDGGLKETELSKKKVDEILFRTANKKYVENNNLKNTIYFASEDIAGNGSYIKCDNGFF